MHDDPRGRPLENAGEESAELKREVERLRAQCRRLEDDLLQARRELAEARVQQENLAEQLSECRAASQPPTPAAVSGRKQGTRSWRNRWSRTARRTDQEIGLLHQSGLFDAEWYLTEYPDVANTRLDPAEHYLLHGAAEGRNPGPQFNTNQYLFDHPDLVDSGENPLLHFLRSRGTTGPR